MEAVWALGWRNKARTAREKWLSAVACFFSVLLTIPILTVVIMAFSSTQAIWPHLWATVLPGYIERTLILMFGVGFVGFVFGTGVAWATTHLEFPGRSFFQWASLMPMAMPGYIVAYTYADFLNYSGPIQSLLRQLMGWNTPADYWFPEIRSLSGAIFIMAMVLYPYIYLTARASFIRQSPNQMEAARVLGQSAWSTFFRIALPQARPAIVVGLSLVLMECLNDIGAVKFFGIETLTLGIYTIWLAQGNLGGATQIAVIILVFVFVLLALERYARSKGSSLSSPARRLHPIQRSKLHGIRAALTSFACFLPIFFGFILPALILLYLSRHHWSFNLSFDYIRAASHSLLLASLVAFLTLLIGLLFAYSNRHAQTILLKNLGRLAVIGYALPGTVLALGVLIPFAAFDNFLSDFFMNQWGFATGLLLSGSIAAVSFAYIVRFLAISFGNIESGLARITPNLDAAARMLGRSPWGSFRCIHIPLLRPALSASLILVFVDCMKELPATLILRPFDFETLATMVFTLASLEQLEESALPALTIVAVGLLPVILLAHTLREPKLRVPVLANYDIDQDTQD